MIGTIKQIIELFEIYTQDMSKEAVNIENFVLWLNNRLFNISDSDMENKHNPDIHLTLLISLLNKHYKSYTRSIFTGTPISNAESYSFLYHLYLSESFRKMELIKIHQLEAPTGIEIIKRLLANKLISEFEDINDKRAKRIKITKTGKELIDRLQPKMDKVYQEMGGNLDINEKIKLIYGLSSLNDYHNSK